MIRRLLLPLLIALTITGCVTTPPALNPLRQASVISVAVPEFETSAETTLAWSSDLIWVGDLDDHPQVQQVFRLHPSLAAVTEGTPKGSVLVALARPGQSAIVWRDALQVFTEPDLLSTDRRMQRMEWGARQLLNSIPTHR